MSMTMTMTMSTPARSVERWLRRLAAVEAREATEARECAQGRYPPPPPPTGAELRQVLRTLIVAGALADPGDLGGYAAIYARSDMGRLRAKLLAAGIPPAELEPSRDQWDSDSDSE